MLALALPRAAALGIARALITCDHDNIASRRMIVRFGGVPAGDGIEVPGKLRFYVPTGAR
jgi:predicted acetyltransferase